MSLPLYLYDSLFILIYSIISPTRRSIYRSWLFLIYVLVCTRRRCFCLCLWSLLVFLRLSGVWIGVSVSSFCGCCSRLESGLVSLFPRSMVAFSAFVLVFWCPCLVPSCSWSRVTVVSLLSLVYLPVYGRYWCLYCFYGYCLCFCGCIW